MSERAKEQAADALFRALVELANTIFDLQCACEDLLPNHEKLDRFDKPLLKVEALVQQTRGAYERVMVRRHQLDGLEALERSRGHNNGGK
jgi:hypothetical protein